MGERSTGAMVEKKTLDTIRGHDRVIQVMFVPFSRVVIFVIVIHVPNQQVTLHVRALKTQKNITVFSPETVLPVGLWIRFEPILRAQISCRCIGFPRYFRQPHLKRLSTWASGAE